MAIVNETLAATLWPGQNPVGMLLRIHDLSEGDVLHRMHSDSTPLVRFIDSWDGSTEPDRAFAALVNYLESFSTNL